LPCLLMVLSLFSFAQPRTVTGRVTDQRDNRGLSGVSVIVKGTTTGTTTDEQGNYAIAVPSRDAVLVFSYTGLGTQEITVGDQSSRLGISPASAPSLRPLPLTWMRWW
jgi:TonB-dependent starch-binding outer membrane protein SusC